jgi:transposase
MLPKYKVTLTADERSLLRRLVASGTEKARKLSHARILLKADASEGGPGWLDEQISTALEVSLATIHRIRRTFVEEGLDAALNRHPQRRHRARRLDGVQEAHLIALTCSQPPEGQARWTLRLLADKMVELEYVDSVSHETIRQVLKKTN